MQNAPMTHQFPRLFYWHVVRYVGRHRLLAVLNVLSVALGLAVYLAIQIANHSANQSFAAGVDLVAGKAHLEVRGEVDETLWPKLAAVAGVKAATGIVEGVVTLPDYPGEYLRILGIDLFSGEAFRTFEVRGTDGALDLESWLGRGDGIAVTAAFAERAGLKAGDPLQVLVDGEVKILRVVALLDASESPGASQSCFATMDIGWAQELFGRAGRLSSLQILADDPHRISALADSLRPLVPPPLTVEPPRQRSQQVQTMLAAFQLNLTALSLVSLLVGVFLIYNTIAASVARRRVEIGILRSLGATRWEVRWLFLGEACLFGALGLGLGTVGGIALAQVLTGAVAKTISSLYLLLSIEERYLSPAQFITAAIFGFGTVLLGAWKPASEAAKIEPVTALSHGARMEAAERRGRSWSWLAAICAGLAVFAGWAALRYRVPALSFGAALFVMVGFSFLSPGTAVRFGGLAARLHRLGILWRLAADHLRRSVHRHAITIAALGAAVAMMTGLSVMIFSFRESVDAWIEHGIVADLFIAPASNETIGLYAAVPPATIEWLRAQAEVESVDTFRESTVALRMSGSEDQPGLLAVVDGSYRHNLQFIGGDETRRMERVLRGGEIAVTEPFARKHGVQAGQRLTLLTPRGPEPFTITGVYSDYTRDQGMMLMSRATYARFWADPAAQSLAVYLRPEASGDAVAERFRERFSRTGEYVIYSNRTLRTRILSIFDQTFAVTYVLRTVAIVVAVAGIFLSVTTLVAEREREIGVLRAIGASPAQIQGMLMTESGMIGLVAAVLGIASGLALALVLIQVVNPAFFGWSIQWRWPWISLLAIPFWMIPVAVAAAWFPAWQACRAPVASTVRAE